MNIANFKGNTYKETVSPFHPKSRRSRARLNYVETEKDRSSTLEVMSKTHAPPSAGSSKKNAWLNQFISANEVRTKPLFQNTVGSFEKNSRKAAVNQQTIVSESQHANMTFKDYDRYSREVSPEGSKTEF